jgi:hypothetical protein
MNVALPVPGGLKQQRHRAPARPIAAACPTAACELAVSTKHPLANAPVRIFQIHFEPWQVAGLDPAFIPFDNQGVPDELLEFAVFERLARSANVEDATIWGALSWRFGEKTGMRGADLLAEIERVPGCDVYYCNPFPQNEALYHNLWVQGETAHSNFLDLVRELLAAAGIDRDETALIETARSFSAANYFIGSPSFWDAYLPFVRRILAPVDTELPPAVRQALHSPDGDARRVHGGASYLPFIVERLFPLFMRSAGAGFRSHKIRLPIVEAGMDVHLTMLREMKDEACRLRSPWLAACWVNYRSLYLKQQHGQAWCSKFLRSVTPTGIAFA